MIRCIATFVCQLNTLTTNNPDPVRLGLLFCEFGKNFVEWVISSTQNVIGKQECSP